VNLKANREFMLEAVKPSGRAAARRP
jgi:hypothetical protein